jgi:hypothetical protein
MSRTRIKDRLSDIDERVVADAEADLDRLLSLEPSPEFAARVLARIKAPHAARGWRAGWAGWAGWALASAAALVIVAALALRSGSSVRDAAVTSPQPGHRDIVLGPDARSPVGGSPKTAPLRTDEPEARHAVVRSLKTVPPRLDQPEVVIDPSLADAIRRLAVSTRNVLLDGTTSDGNLQPASDVPLSSVVVEPLAVPELVLKPADQNGGQ